MLGKWGVIKTIASGILGCTIIVMLVVSLSNSTLKVNNNISFSIADEIGAEIMFSGTNSGEKILNTPDKLIIKPTETELNKTITIPNQKFSSLNSEIVYVFKIKNTSETKSFTATASIADISTELENKISGAISYKKVGSDSYENANTVSVGETTEITITFKLLDDTSSFDYSPSIRIEMK